jgi:hypothetical protein
MESIQQNTRCPYCDYEFTADLWPSDTSEDEMTTNCKKCGKKFSILVNGEVIRKLAKPAYIPGKNGTTISTESEDYRLPPRTSPLSKKAKILLVIVAVAVILIIVFAIIELTYVKTTYTMMEFQDEFDYGHIITSKDIPSKYLNRDLYIEDTITQMELVYTSPYSMKVGTGMNFISTGRHTSMSQDSQYVEFDLVWDSDITDSFDVGNKVKITVIINGTSGGYHFDFTKIELI